jgi:hypothetical protein
MRKIIPEIKYQVNGSIYSARYCVYVSETSDIIRVHPKFGFKEVKGKYEEVVVTSEVYINKSDIIFMSDIY